jgi:hypothetical protein
MLACCMHWDAGCGYFGGVSHARAYPPRSVPLSHHSAGYAIPIDQRWVYGCVCTYIYIYIFLMSFGLDPGDRHDGTFGSCHHRPARVSGLDPGDRHDGRFSAAGTPAWHVGSARTRPWRRPPNVGITRRCWLPSRAVKADGTHGPPEIAPRVGAAPAASRTCGVGWLPGHRPCHRYRRYSWQVRIICFATSTDVTRDRFGSSTLPSV